MTGCTNDILLSNAQGSLPFLTIKAIYGVGSAGLGDERGDQRSQYLRYNYNRERSARRTEREELDRAREAAARQETELSARDEELARARAERDAARNELLSQGRQADAPPTSCGPGCVTL